MHGVGQIAAIDAQIVELMRIEFEQAVESDPLGAIGACFTEPGHETREQR